MDVRKTRPTVAGFERKGHESSSVAPPDAGTGAKDILPWSLQRKHSPVEAGETRSRLLTSRTVSRYGLSHQACADLLEQPRDAQTTLKSPLPPHTYSLSPTKPSASESAPHNCFKG